jgi:hypothetical protein
MNDADWDKWIIAHTTAFGMSKRQTDMVKAWRAAFIADRYTPEELASATQALLVLPDLHPNNHPPYIASHIRNLRAVAYQRSQDTAPDLGRCVKCNGTGRVIVPLIRPGNDGTWKPLKVARAGATYYTQAVLCDCIKGLAMAGNQDDRRPRMMTLEQYQAINPNWESQLEDRHHALKQRAESAPPSPTRSDRDSAQFMEGWNHTIDRLLQQAGINPVPHDAPLLEKAKRTVIETGGNAKIAEQWRQDRPAGWQPPARPAANQPGTLNHQLAKAKGIRCDCIDCQRMRQSNGDGAP